MIKQKILTLLVLLMTAVSGAWAAPETPLITIESTGENASFKSGSKTFDDKVTVTFSGNVGNDNDNWGWYTYSTSEITLTVTAAEGYTITGVKFTNNSGSAFDASAPFEAILVYDGGVVTKVNGTSIGQLGVTKIEVYGYAGTPATVAVMGVMLSQPSATLTLGETETVTLTPTVLPDDATDKSVTWSSSNEAVATVSNEGVVTAVAAGTATITVTATNGTDVTTDDQTATCTVTVAAPTSWVRDGDEWDDATKTLTVNSNLPENAYKGQTEIEHVIINDGVTSIGNSAFDICTGLTSITIPNGVTSIGEAAFARCTGLTSITIPNSVTIIGNAAFYQCSGLTSITIPNSVTIIGNLAFRYCSGLETVTILAESLESYGTNAFQGTAEGLKIYVPAGSVATYKTAWADYADKIVAIPPAWLLEGDDWDDATKTLTVNSNPGSRAYSGASDIENLVISDAVTSIGEKAFFGCEGLTSVTIGNSVTSIGEAAFVLCKGLTSIVVASGNTTYDSRENCNAIIETSSNTLIAGCKSTIIPNSVTSIGEYAFEYCTGLTSITIPNSVTSIGQTAFSSCSNLTSVTIGNSVTSIGAAAFMACGGLTSVTIGNSVESIGEWAFLQCSSLTSITIPNSVTSIGDQAFAGCTGLTSIEIPNGVTSIGVGAFYQCTGLTSITIPSSVENIGEGAFYECSGLETVTILAESLESYGSGAFEDTAEGLKIYVPAGSVDTYKAAWADYADQIEAIAGGDDVTLTDGDTYTRTLDMTVASATYVKSIAEERVGLHQAWLVPFDYTLTSDDMNAFSFYKINMIANAPNPETEASDDIWVFLKRMNEGEVLHANMPYVYRAKRAVENYEFTTSNAMLKGKNTGVLATMQTMEETYTLYGTYEGTTATAADPFYYVNIDGNLSLGNDGTVTVGAFRWIMRVESKFDTPNAYARTIHFFDGEDGETTNITTTNLTNETKNEWYSLDGRRIEQPKKGGLYIVNGKKVVIK